MRKTWIWTLVILVLLAALSYAGFVYFEPPSLPEGIVYGNGRVEGTEVVVSSEARGRVVENRLVEGEAVAEGDLLVRIDDSELQAQIRGLKAERQAIEQERAGVEETLATWRHHRTTAENELERHRELFEDGILAEQQLEGVENKFEEAEGRVRSLEAQLKQTASRLEALDEQVNLIKVQLGKTTIHAPAAGTVLTRGIEEGEVALPGRTLAVIVDMENLDLRVFIPEEEIGKIKLGDDSRVKVDAFPEQFFEARVKRIDQEAQFTPKDVHVPEERTRTVFGVTLALESPGGYLKPGMPADAWIRWKPEVAWPETLPVPY